MDMNTNMVSREPLPCDGEASDKETQKRKRLRSILSIICIALSTLFIIVSILSSVIIVQGWLFPERPPSVFGITPAVMANDSMASSKTDAIAYGDILFLKKTESKELQSGDIIAFYEKNILYIGRIRSIRHTEDDFACTVQADNLNAPYPYLITSQNTIGKIGLQIKGLGAVALFILTPLGTFLLCWIPALFCIGILLFEWWLVRKKDKEQEADEASESEEESQNADSGEESSEIINSEGVESYEKQNTNQE